MGQGATVSTVSLNVAVVVLLAAERRKRPIARRIHVHPLLGATPGCGLGVGRGTGRAVLLTAELASDPALFTTIARHLGAEPGLLVAADNPGLIATTTATTDGQRLVHLINVIGYDTTVRLTLNGQALHDGNTLVVPGHSGHMLPLGLRLPTTAATTVAWASAEITTTTPDSVTFGTGLGGPGGHPGTMVVLETDAQITTTPGVEIQHTGRRWTITAPPGHGPLRLGIARP